MPESVPFRSRLLFAFAALLAGEAALPLLSPLHPQLLRMGMIAAAIGWAFIGLPIVLPLGSRTVARLPWPVVLITGACLGPLALLVMFLTAALLQGQNIAAFSLSPTGTLWPAAIAVSTISVVVYSALMRRSSRVRS